MFIFVGVAAVVVVAVIGLAIYQAASGGATKLPERVVTGQGRVLGDANAPVTIVEYADFQCPVCRRAQLTVLPQIEKDYIETGKVKLEWRNFAFLGQESLDAAQAADAAGDQGMFWEYHDALFNAQGQENSGTFGYDTLVKLAQDVGLDVPTFEATLTANTHLAAIQREKDTASAAGISSTPTFFIGATKIVGLQNYTVFQQTIDTELQKAGVE